MTARCLNKQLLVFRQAAKSNLVRRDINKLLSTKDVVQLTIFSQSKIYKMIKAGKFPEQINKGEPRVGWRSSDIQVWLDKDQPRFSAFLYIIALRFQQE